MNEKLRSDRTNLNSVQLPLLISRSPELGVTSHCHSALEIQSEKRGRDFMPFLGKIWGQIKTLKRNSAVLGLMTNE